MMKPTPMIFPKQAKILFIGDSITDGDRSRTGDVNHSLGDTYVRLIAARYGYDHPGDSVEFINRGINGHRITDLAPRWEEDCISHRPDLLTIFVGVNDAASVVELTIPPPPRVDGRPPKSLVTLDLFRETYDLLLTRTRRELPNTKIILCTPFVLPEDKIGKDWNLWSAEVGRFASTVVELAEKHGTYVIEWQPLFNAALNKAPASFWMPDGVHPSAAGHQLMADEWINVAANAVKDD
jgi:lysophospholipase L1-like esterase